MKLIRNRLFLATICVLCSALCVYGFLAQNQSEDITVYKLNTSISKGTEITNDMLISVEVGTKGMENIIAEKDNIIGSFASCDLVSGQFVYETSITQTETLMGIEKLDGTNFAYTISAGSLASSLANNIESGDIVSIYVNTNGLSVLPNELKYVEVLYSHTSTGAEKTPNSEESVSAITFIVDESQAKLLNEYEYTSNIHIALVYRGDDEEIKENYLSKWGFEYEKNYSYR